MRLFLALLLVLQSTSCFACPYGSWTFDFAKVGATSRYAKGAILVIGRVAEVAPADKRGIHVVTIEVLKPYTDDLHLGPSAMVTALAEMTDCGERVVAGEIGLYALRGEIDGFHLASRQNGN